MNNRPEIDRYVLTEMDEEGNVWCEYSGKNNFSFHTMTDLLVSFRVFRIAMHVLAFIVRSGRIQTAFSTILGNGEIIHAKSD